MDKGCNLCKCKPRSAGEGRSVTLKNLVRSEVRSGVRVRKKCLNHPTAAERGCCQFTEKVIKIANENLVRGEVRVKYAARTRTNGLRTLPPDLSVFRGMEAHRLLAGPEGGSKPTGKPAPPCGFRKPRSAGGRACNEILPTIKKGSHCYICNTFEKASFMPEFQRSASGL